MAHKTKASATTTSTNIDNPNTPCDNLKPDVTASSQEASTPLQTTTLNTTKKLTSKAKYTAGPVTTTLSDPNYAATLLTRVAEQQGK